MKILFLVALGLMIQVASYAQPAPLWEYEVKGETVPIGTTAGPKNVIFLSWVVYPKETTTVAAIDTTNGKPLWTLPLEKEAVRHDGVIPTLSGPMTWDGTQLLLPLSANGLWAISPEGKVNWKLYALPKTYADAGDNLTCERLVLDKDKSIIAVGNASIWKIDSKGKILDRKATNGFGRIIGSAGDGYLGGDYNGWSFFYDRKLEPTGELEPDPYGSWEDPVLPLSNGFFLWVPDKAVAVGLTGKALWNFSVQGHQIVHKPTGHPAGFVVIPVNKSSGKGGEVTSFVYGVDQASGKVLWKYGLEPGGATGTSPIVASDGTIFIVSGRSEKNWGTETRIHRISAQGKGLSVDMVEKNKGKIGTFYESFLLTADGVMVYSKNNVLYAYNVSVGASQYPWSAHWGGPFRTSAGK